MSIETKDLNDFPSGSPAVSDVLVCGRGRKLSLEDIFDLFAARLAERAIPAGTPALSDVVACGRGVNLSLEDIFDLFAARLASTASPASGASSAEAGKVRVRGGGYGYIVLKNDGSGLYPEFLTEEEYQEELENENS